MGIEYQRWSGAFHKGVVLHFLIGLALGVIFGIAVLLLHFQPFGLHAKRL
jgi:hypothetical protein